MTNDSAGNAVVQYSRAADGRLTFHDVKATGGSGGTGNGVGKIDPLGSQHSLILNGDGSRLLAVNAGSDEISSMAAAASGLMLLSKAPSGGTFPNSIARFSRFVGGGHL